MALESLTGLNYPDHIKVIIWKGGGDDTLNAFPTLSQYTEYANRRPTVGLKNSDILRLNGVDHIGMHPALSGLRNLYDDGNLALFPSVGYDNFDRSHFSGTDRVLSGKDGHTPLSEINTGLHARLISGLYPNYPLGYPNSNSDVPPMLATGITPNMFLTGPNGNSGLIITGGPDIYRRLVKNTNQDPSMTDAMGLYYENIRYIDSLNYKIEDYSETLSNLYKASDNEVQFLSGRASDQLAIISRLIKSGSRTKVYVVSVGGFDTHSNQVSKTDPKEGTHAELLADISSGTSSFVADLKLSGDFKRILLLMHSEFGRNINQNESYGTDHGTSGAMVVIGEHVKGGVYGDYPLIIKDNITGDAFNKYAYHYNQIHRTIGESFLGLGDIGLGLMGLNQYAPIDFLTDTDSGKEKDLNHIGDKIVADNVVVEEITADSVEDTYTILENQSLTANVSLNDTPCSEGNTLYSLLFGTEVGGQVLSFNTNTGEFTFLPDTGFIGEASFQYSVFCDEVEDSSKVTILVEEDVVVVGEEWREAITALDQNLETFKTDILAILQQINLDQKTQDERLDGLNSGLTEINQKISNLSSRLSTIDNSISELPEIKDIINQMKNIFS